MGNKLRLTGKQLRRIISEAMSGRGIPAESMAPRDPRRSVNVKMDKADQIVADAAESGGFNSGHVEAILDVLKLEDIPQKFSTEDQREIWTDMGIQSIINKLVAMTELSSDEIWPTWAALGDDIKMVLLRIATDFEGFSTLNRKAAARGYTEDPLMTLVKKNPSALHVKDLDMDSLD